MTQKITLLALTSTLILAMTITPLTAWGKTKGADGVDATCIKAALDKRDTAIIAGAGVFASSTVSALSSRLAALKTAWDKSAGSERTLALRGAWRSFQQAKRQTRQIERQTTNGAWRTFYADRRACGSTAAQTDITTEQADRVE